MRKLKGDWTPEQRALLPKGTPRHRKVVELGPPRPCPMCDKRMLNTSKRIVCERCRYLPPKGLKGTQRVRWLVLQKYACRCACCGETEAAFLAVDHIDGAGHQHRREMRGNKEAYSIYRWLLRHNFPPGFQLLCHNCNLAKGFYGSCPHQLKPEERSPLDGYASRLWIERISRIEQEKGSLPGYGPRERALKRYRDLAQRENVSVAQVRTG